jgi:hypothetical protein
MKLLIERGLCSENPALKRLASTFWGESRISAKNRRSLHISRSHRATDVGSNGTQVPMRNDGILPAFACLKIVIFETANMLASSSAVKARRTVSAFSYRSI